MMLFYEKPKEEIVQFIKRLEEQIMSLCPCLFYLQQNDINETIKRITDIRTKENWGGRVAKLIANSPFGKTHNLTGFDGMVDFFKRRKEMDLAIINSLEMNCILIDNEKYDWEAVQKKVFKVLETLIDA